MSFIYGIALRVAGCRVFARSIADGAAGVREFIAGCGADAHRRFLLTLIIGTRGLAYVFLTERRAAHGSRDDGGAVQRAGGGVLYPRTRLVARLDACFRRIIRGLASVFRRQLREYRCSGNYGERDDKRDEETPWGYTAASIPFHI